jgi:hypothetical protein
VHLYPDYGLFLLSQGYAREVRHCFYDIPFNHITVIGQDQFSTMKNHVFAGVEYAMSLDFDFRILADILSLGPPVVVDHVRAELSRDPISPRIIQFPQNLSVGVEATLGQLQRGLHDEFVPLVIARVLKAKGPEGERLQLDQDPVREISPLPSSLTVDGRPSFVHIVARRSDVEKCTIEPTLKALQFLDSDPETALRYRNNATLSFQGYDQDPRALFQIEEVRQFVEKLNVKWYMWFFFMTKDVNISPLAAITLCLCRYKRSRAGRFRPVVTDSKGLFKNHFTALRFICKTCNLSDEQIESAVEEAIDYFMKVDFVSGCDTPQLAIDSAKTGTVIQYIRDDTK